MTQINESTTNNKISATQFFSIIFIARMFSLFTYIVVAGGELNATDKLVHVLLSFLLFFLFLFPVYWYVRNSKGLNIFDSASVISPWLAKVFAVGYLVMYCILIVFSAIRFEMFASSVMFPEAELGYFILIIFVLAVYSAYLGIEAIGRASMLFSVLTVATLIFVSVILLKKFDFINLSPPLYNGIKDPMQAAVYSVCRSVDMLSVLILLPKIGGNLKKGFWKWFLIFFCVVVFGVSVLIGVLGEYGDTQLFQFYSFIVLAEVGTLQRLDALLTALWILGAFLKISYLIFMVHYILESVFKVKKKKTAMCTVAGVCFVLTTYISGSLKRFSVAGNPHIIESFFVVFAIIIPLFVVIGLKIKRKREVT